MLFLIHLIVFVIIITVPVTLFLLGYLRSPAFQKFLDGEGIKMFPQTDAKKYLRWSGVLLIGALALFVTFHVSSSMYASSMYHKSLGIYQSQGDFSRVVVSKHHVQALQDNDTDTKSNEGFNFYYDKVKKNGTHSGIVLYGKYKYDNTDFDHSHDGTLLVGLANRGKTLELNSYGDKSQPDAPHFDDYNCQRKMADTLSDF